MNENCFKCLWSGGYKTDNGVGLIIANQLIGKVMGVERYNDRVLKINIVIGDVVWELVYCYYLQAGRSVNEKNGFYEPMDKVVMRQGIGRQ